MLSRNFSCTLLEACTKVAAGADAAEADGEEVWRYVHKFALKTMGKGTEALCRGSLVVNMFLSTVWRRD